MPRDSNWQKCRDLLREVLFDQFGIGALWRFFKKEGRGVKQGWVLFAVLLSVAVIATNRIDHWASRKFAPPPKEIENLRPYTEPTFFGQDMYGNNVIGVFFGVINSGPPTVLQGLEATFNFRDATVEKIGPVLIPDDAHVTVYGKEISLRRSDMLYDKVMNTIPTGGLMQGYVIYVFKGVNPESVKDVFSYTIYFRDAANNEYQVTNSSVKLGDPNHASGLHPGMGNPMAPFADWTEQIPRSRPSLTPSRATSPR